MWNGVGTWVEVTPPNIALHRPLRVSAILLLGRNDTQRLIYRSSLLGVKAYV